MKIELFFFGILFTTIGCNSQKELNSEQKQWLDTTKKNMVLVEGGIFQMGKNGLPGSNPAHEVTLDSYSMSKYETTFEDYDQYTSISGVDQLRPDYRDLDDYQPRYGVKAVTWQMARDYCVWLGQRIGVSMDLPTESQWEYAARSRGLAVQHATDSGKIEGSYTEKRNYDGSTIEVGSYPPNPLGIYDMSGGRPEWVRDWFFRYDEQSRNNPVQDTILYSKQKIVRGWHTLSNSVYGRGKRPPEQDGAGVGFRCVCNQKTPIE